MSTGNQIFSVEVDVAITRPMTPENRRTVFITVSVPLDLPNFEAEVEAREIAVAIASATRGIGTALPGRSGRHPVMAVASRIVGLVL